MYIPKVKPSAMRDLSEYFIFSLVDGCYKSSGCVKIGKKVDTSWTNEV